ncbi:MAG: hypothetical protein ACXV3D_02760 [Halobacteriota archaeon]
MSGRSPEDDVFVHPTSPGTEHDELVARCVSDKGLEDIMRLIGPEEPQTRDLGPYFRCGYYTGDYANPFHKPRHWRIIETKTDGVGKCVQLDLDTCCGPLCQQDCYVNLETGELCEDPFDMPAPRFIREASYGPLSRSVIFDVEVVNAESFLKTHSYADILIRKGITCGYRCAEQDGMQWGFEVTYQQEGEDGYTQKWVSHITQEELDSGLITDRWNKEVPKLSVEEFEAGDIIENYLLEVKPTLVDIGAAIRQLDYYHQNLRREGRIGKIGRWGKVAGNENRGRILGTHLALITYSRPNPKYVQMAQLKGISVIRCDKDNNAFELLGRGEEPTDKI